MAAVYVYYQMRLYLIQKGHSEWPKAAGAQTNELPMTSADVDKDTDSKAEMERMGGITLVSVAEKVNDGWSTPRCGSGSRRPFLHSTSSFTIPQGQRGVTRTKSLPSSHAQEMQDIFARQSSSGSPLLTPGSASFDSRADDDRIQDPDTSITSTMHSDVPMLRLPLSANPDIIGSPSRASFQLADAQDYERGTASMDMWRPESMTLGTLGKQARWRAERHGHAHVAGGRDIAADADDYARAHGARRPDYGRRRGESSAALLPRPTDDESASISGVERLQSCVISLH